MALLLSVALLFALAYFAENYFQHAVNYISTTSVKWLLSRGWSKAGRAEVFAMTVEHQPDAERLARPQIRTLADFDLWLEAGQTEKHYWLDLWRYRELFAILAWRDVAIRYKQTVAGAAWAIVQPFLSMLIMTLIFGKVAGLPTEGAAPYAIMVFAALLPWQFFANSLSNSSQSLVGNANLISKVYFPRLIIPTSSVVVACIDFLVSFVTLIGLMAWYRFIPSARILTLPFFVLFAFLAALGPGLIITALNVKYLDVRFVIPFIVQFGLYVSPVAYSSDVIRAKTPRKLVFALQPEPHRRRHRRLPLGHPRRR